MKVTFELNESDRSFLSILGVAMQCYVEIARKDEMEEDLERSNHFPSI